MSRHSIVQAAGIVLAAVLLIPPAHAALEWTTRSFEGEARPLQKTMRVTFAFKNSGPAPVNVHDLRTNCDCLEAGTDKLTYAPGESGVVTATFTVGQRYGLYERAVTLVTDEAASPHRLTVRIDVPEPAAFSPRTLEWKLGTEPREQTADLVVADGIALDFGEVLPSNRNFRARLETLEPGRRYRLLVAPVSTADPANGALRVKGKSADGEEIVVSAYANVR